MACMLSKWKEKAFFGVLFSVIFLLVVYSQYDRSILDLRPSKRFFGLVSFSPGSKGALNATSQVANEPFSGVSGYKSPIYVKGSRGHDTNASWQQAFAGWRRNGSLERIPEYVRSMPRNFSMPKKEELEKEKGALKTILAWNWGYSSDYGFGFGREPFQRAHCGVDRCFFTANRSLLPVDEFDAILFHFRATSKNDLPSKRSPGQRWIFWEAEPAAYIYQEPGIYDGFFNWTMTYKLDSDIPRPYGRVYRQIRPTRRPQLVTNYAEGKMKMVAWFVSNCVTSSRREKLVKELQKYIEVDIFGKCGDLTCSRTTSDKCYEMLDQDYRFYLSFENSLCKDYVTEKYFSVLRYNILPVVYGFANYSSFGPPHSFVHALSFKNPKKLAKYLRYLARNATAYNEYFKWKPYYHVDEGWSNIATNFCHLCHKLHTDNQPKVYRDLNDWFVLRSHCTTGHSFYSSYT